MLEAYVVAQEIIAALAPLMPTLMRHDKDLAVQLRKAASSVLLNVGEGQRRRRIAGGAGGVRRAWARRVVARLRDGVVGGLGRPAGGEGQCARDKDDTRGVGAHDEASMAEHVATVGVAT